MKKILNLSLQCGLLSLLSLYLGACVLTPDGRVVAATDLDPEIVVSSKSGVTVRIGPSYTVDDAFALANRHCKKHGYYAVASSKWPHRYNHPRKLAYHCKRRGPSFVPPGHRKDWKWKHKKKHKHKHKHHHGWDD